MGPEEAWSGKRLGEIDGVLWEPLSMGSEKNGVAMGYLKRNSHSARLNKLPRLLSGPTCLEIELNRRMPNGTSGGVRGRGEPSLLDYEKPPPLRGALTFLARAQQPGARPVCLRLSVSLSLPARPAPQGLARRGQHEEKGQKDKEV